MEPVFEFPLDLAKRGPGSRVQQLHQQLRAAIIERRLAAGARLPSTRRVAQAYGIARNTVIAAYDLLTAEGFIVPRAGAAAEVADVATQTGMRGRMRQPRLAPRPPAMDWRNGAAPSTAIARSSNLRSFELGVPEQRWFPSNIWRRALMRASSLGLADAFGYPAPEGRPLLRAAIAQHVAYARAVVCTDNDVVVTSGAQQAFDLLARVLVTRGQTKVAVEDPGYPPLRAAMSAAGAQLVPVSVDEEGLIVDRLPSDVRIVCVTPSHQFPTGVAMSLARRRALLDFAQRHGAVIIEDDYDGEFRYGTQPLDALQMLDRNEKVVYVGTFSKSLFPALRLGYVVAPPWLLKALTAAKQSADNGGNVAVQEAVARLILDGDLARHTRRMRKHYASRRDTLLAALDRELGNWLIPIAPSAGIHLYARYRDRRQAPRIASLTAQYAAGARDDGAFLLARRAGANSGEGIAFGFGCIDEEEIEASIARLARALGRT